MSKKLSDPGIPSVPSGLLVTDLFYLYRSASAAGSRDAKVPATALQPASDILSAFSGLTFAANKFPYATSSSALALADISAFGRSLIDDANASTARSTLGLGTIATQSAASVSITGGDIVSSSIVGTSTNDSAGAGRVGEYKETEVLAGSAVSLTSGNAADVATLDLTAGDWDVHGNIVLVPAGTPTAMGGWISTTSVTAPTAPNKGSRFLFQGTMTNAAGQMFPVGARRISLASPATVYLSTLCVFGSTAAAHGHIWARRAR